MSETNWLSAKQQRSWRSYLQGVSRLYDRLERDLREKHNLTLAEYEIMVRLSEQPDRTLRMAELAGELAHSRSRMSHTINRLENGGLVTRQTCSADGRGIEAVLTDAGFKKLSEASHTHVAGVRNYFVDLTTAEEFEIVGKVLQKVAENLETD